MNTLNGLPSLLRDQSEEIERLSMDYAVERTLMAGIVTALEARGLMAAIDFDTIVHVGTTVGSEDFSVSLLRRVESIRSGL